MYVERSILLCYYHGGSTIGGSTVRIPKYVNVIYLPFGDEVSKKTEKVGGVCTLRALAEHEASFSVGVLHLGKGLPEVGNLLVCMVVEAVH